MDNVLQLPQPDDPIQQIHDYARDLAYLYVRGEISPLITLGRRYSWSDSPHRKRESDTQNRIDFRTKWGSEDEQSKAPAFDLLNAYGYVEVISTQQEDVYIFKTYVLTPKAFQLLEKPAKAPSVFISYSRRDSSAFALLIEARLRFVGADHVFIDKNIAAGDDWAELLQETIQGSKHFICLVGPNTLKSREVKKEIQWALDAGCRVVSIWHNGSKMDDDCPEELRKLHAITVTGESAREYETAISELLNSLGYRTY